MLRWPFLFLLSAGIASPVLLRAQTVPAKPEPRAGDPVPPPSAQPMPKFDVPDFVITGSEAIDLPLHEKEGSAEPPAAPGMQFPDPVRTPRDRETVELASRVRERASASVQPPAFVKASASMGTYLTPELRLWAGQDDGTNRFLVRARYRQTDGFGFNTGSVDRGFGISGATVLPSEGSRTHGMPIGGSIDLHSRSYGLYGSIAPRQRRSRTGMGVDAWVQRPVTGGVPFDVRLRAGSVLMADSARSARENRLEVSALTSWYHWNVPWHLTGTIQTAGISSAGSGGASLLRLSIISGQVPWDVLVASGGLQLFWGSGTGGQHTVRVYPMLNVMVRLSPEHVAEGRFAPEVQWETFDRLTSVNPYLDLAASVRNRIVTNTGALFLNSEWKQGLRTRIGLEFRTVDDDALFADTASTGIWDIVHGRTTTGQLSSEMFATLTPNDYFSAGLKFTSSKSAGSGYQVPYLPWAEAVARYEHRFSPAFRIFGLAKYAHRRSSDLKGTDDLPAVLLADAGMDFRIDQSLSAFLTAHNLLDRRYELWRGYRESPLTIVVGIGGRW